MRESVEQSGERSLAVLASGTLRMLLAAVRATPPGRTLCPADEAIDELLDHVRRDEATAALVTAALTGALETESAAWAQARPHALAVAWGARGEGWSRAVALLWAAARQPEAVYRKLEARFVDDLEQAASLEWMCSRGCEPVSRPVARSLGSAPSGPINRHTPVTTAGLRFPGPS